MAERAQVTSVEAVESFRADLIVFQSRARVVLEEACDEVLHTKVWVQIDRRRYWTAEARRRSGMLEKARADLSSARLSQFNESTTLPMMMVQRAERADQAAKAKMAKALVHRPGIAGGFGHNKSPRFALVHQSG